MDLLPDWLPASPRRSPRTAEVTVDGAHSDPIPRILAGIPLSVKDIQVFSDGPKLALNPTSCESDVSLDVNLSATVVRLPRSAFLDQSHIRTICTRVQYAAKACPPGSIYGHVRVFTPLLSEPLEGPAYLRSSNHNLPDLVFSLHGLVDFEAVGRIDSKNGGIRASFEGIPDAPISKAVINMQGGKKGLIINSTNLCGAKHRADATLDAHNSKRVALKPVMRASCGGGHKKHRRG
jgi:hypothetical protein